MLQMKRTFLIAAFSVIMLASYAAMPNQKVLEAFRKTFQPDTEVSWGDAEDGFEASFKQNNISFRVFYDKDGTVLSSVRYYKAPSLPVIIRGKVEMKFKDKEIFGVTEVTTEDQVTYHIVLEGPSSWINVQSDALGNFSNKKEFKKQ